VLAVVCHLSNTETAIRQTARLVEMARGVGVRLKVWGINIEKIEGVGSGEGLCPPQLGPGGLPADKNQFCTKNYAILSKFWYFFPILQQKVVDYPQC